MTTAYGVHSSREEDGKRGQWGGDAKKRAAADRDDRGGDVDCEQRPDGGRRWAVASKQRRRGEEEEEEEEQHRGARSRLLSWGEQVGGGKDLGIGASASHKRLGA